MKSLSKNVQQALTAAMLILLGQGSAAQNLNEAVASQLNFDPNAAQNCAGLIGPGGDIGTLADGLQRLCGRPSGQGAPPNANGGGGGAATATSAPTAVIERMESDEEQTGEERKFSFFASAGFSPFDRSVSQFEDGYQSDIVSLTAGVDMRMPSGLVLGLAVTGARQSGDFTGGGELDVDSIGLTGFGSHSFGQNGYVQLFAGITQSGHDRTRIATFREFDADTDLLLFEAGGLQSAEFDATEINAGIVLGYPLVFDNITVGPVLSWDYSNTGTDTYSESFAVSEFTLNVDEELASALALTFYDTTEISSLTSVGIEGSAAISTSWGVVMVQQNLLWRFEHNRDQRSDEASFVQDTLARRFTFQTEPGDDQYLEYSLGFNFIRASGMNFYLNFSAISSHRFYSTRQFTFGFHRGF